MADETQSILGAAQQAAGGQGTSVLEAARSVAGEDQPSILDAASQAAAPVKPKASLMAAANTFIEQTFSQPQGQFGAAEDIAGKTTSVRSPFDLLSAARRLGQLAFPEISKKPPTTKELTDFSKQSPEFAATMQGLDDQRAQSYEKAKALGDNPDWDTIEEKFMHDTYAQVAQARAQGIKSTPEGPLPDPRNTEDMMRFIARTAEPGVTRRPIQDSEVASAGWQSLKAQNSAEIDALPWWVRNAIRAGAEGVKFGVLSRAGLSGGTLGAASEAANQLMGVASGQRSELDPGQVLLSGLLMKGASAAGAGVKAAGGNAASQLGATVGVFEGANLASKGVQAMTPQKGTPEEEHGWLATLASHILDMVSMGGAAAAVGGHTGGKLKPDVAKSADYGTFDEKTGTVKPPEMAQPEAASIPLETPAAEPGKKLTDYEASKQAAEALRRTLSKIPGVAKEEPERITARRAAIEKDLIPVLAEGDKAQAELKAALEKAAPGDEELQQKLNDATRIVVQTDGKIPVPEVTVVPEAFTDVLDKQMKLGEAGLAMGRLLHKYGALPYARYQQPGTTSDIIVKQGEAPPPGAKLVGGLLYAEERGHYYKQITAGEFVPDPAQPVLRGKGGGAAPAPLVGEAAGSLMKRQKPFDDAFQERPLDLSLQKAYEVFLGQGELVRKQAWLDLSRQEGDWLPENKLPNAAAREQARQRIEMIDREVKKKRAELKLFSPEDQLKAKPEITALLKEKIDLQAALKNKLYKVLEGKQYGQFEGGYLHRDALAKIGDFSKDESNIGTFMRILTANVKLAKVGANPALFMPDMIGNILHLRNIGINALRNYGHAVAVNLGKAAKNATDYTFDALVKARRAAIGGPTDVTADDMVAIKRIDRRISELEEQGKNVTGLKLERVMAQHATALKELNDYFNSRGIVPQLLYRVPQAALNILMRLPHWRQAMVDHAAARSAFHELTQTGIGDSGPLGASEAFDFIQGAMDYRTLPNWIQKLANIPLLGPMFIRWPSKIMQSSILQGMQRKPNLGGFDIPTPMDSIIAADPKSRSAQIALFARGMLRLAVTGSEPLALLAGSQTALAAAHGISKKELDQALDDRFDYLPGPLAWLTKRTFLPTGRDVYGQVDGIDAGQAIPSLVAMRYFSYSFEPHHATRINETTGKREIASPGSMLMDIAFQLSQKNVMGGSLVRGIAGENQQGKPIEKGFGPGQSWWGAETVAVPSLILRPLEAYFQAQNVPPEERSVMRDVLKTFVGVPMTVLPDKDFIEKEVDRLFQEGVLGIDQKDNGVWSYYVKDPKSLDALMSRAQTIVEAYYNESSDLARSERKRYRALQNALEGIGR